MKNQFTTMKLKLRQLASKSITFEKEKKQEIRHPIYPVRAFQWCHANHIEWRWGCVVQWQSTAEKWVIVCYGIFGHILRSNPLQSCANIYTRWLGVACRMTLATRQVQSIDHISVLNVDFRSRLLVSSITEQK